MNRKDALLALKKERLVREADILRASLYLESRRLAPVVSQVAQISALWASVRQGLAVARLFRSR